jgi:biuret amidohydrolase
MLNEISSERSIEVISETFPSRIDLYRDTGNRAPDMLEVQGRKIPETLSEVVDPKHTLLAIHDMQNYMCDPEESGPTFTPDPTSNQKEAVERIVHLREAARKSGVRVLHTWSAVHDLQVWEANTDYQLYRDRDIIKKTGKPKIRTPKRGESAWDFIDELKPAPGEIVLHKPRTDAFLGTDYQNILHTLGIRTIIETGRAIEIGIEAAARAGVLLGYLVVVVKDCIMGRNPEIMKDSMRWFERSVILPSSKDILEAWSK